MLSWGASRDQAVVTDLARFAVGACPITVDGKLGVVAVRSERDRSISAVDVFSIPDQRLISRIQTGQASRIELSARGRFLAAISPRGQLTVFETARGRALPFRESYGMPGSQVGEAAGFDGVGAVAFAPDERLVAVSTRKAALLFDTSGMRKVGSIPFDEGQSVRELRFSPDSKVVAFSGGDGIRLWGVNPIGETARLLAPRGRELTSLTFSPDGKTLAVGTSQEWVPGSPVYSNREGIVDVWDLSGVDPPRVLGGHTGTVRAIGFAADGARLVVATSEPAMSARSSGQEGEVVVWDVQRARRSRSIEPPGWESSADAVAVSPDGRLAAAGIFRFAPLEYESEVSAFTNAEYLGEIRIWEEPDGPILRTFSTGESTMFALGFSPNANRLATAHEGLVSLWDVDSGRRILDLKPGTRYPKNPSVRCLAFLNRERLVSGDGSGEIHVWDTRSGTKLEAVPAHSTEIRALAIDPKGQLIASGGCSGELRLWQIERWSSVATSQHATTGCVIALAFSPDGRWLASAGEDGVVRMWDRSGRWQLLMVTVPHSNEWIVAAPDGSYEGTAPSWLAIRRGLAALPIEDAVGVRRVKGLLGAVLGISRP
jgi:WD40 repeat protein